MGALGLLMLGAFIGWVICYGLFQTTNWNSPAILINAVIAAAVSGAVFSFITWLQPNGEAVYWYPVGLAYGALCNALGYVAFHAYPDDQRPKTSTRFFAGFCILLASALLALLLLSSWFRGLLPEISGAA
jgi:hypothetical protein